MSTVTAAAINTTYEPFAIQPEYVELNRSFIRTVLPHCERLDVLVDVACGTGTLTALLAAELERHDGDAGDARQPRGHGLEVLGVDLSTESLRLACETLVSLRVAHSGAAAHEPVLQLRAHFVRGSGLSLPAPDSVADGALIGNAIHLFVEKPALVREVHRVLRPGGVFAFNTGFYDGARHEGTDHFYEEWFKRSLRLVKQRQAEAGAAADSAGRRRGAGRAFSNPWLSPAEYSALVEGAGFRLVDLRERAVELSRSNLEAIASYAEFAAAVLSGYPVGLACEALVTTVAPTLASLGLATVPRRWLEVTAVSG